jgi:hypothetical protein
LNCVYRRLVIVAEKNHCRRAGDNAKAARFGTVNFVEDLLNNVRTVRWWGLEEVVANNAGLRVRVSRRRLL